MRTKRALWMLLTLLPCLAAASGCNAAPRTLPTDITLPAGFDFVHQHTYHALTDVLRAYTGAAGTVHGALQTGSLTTTFTASTFSSIAWSRSTGRKTLSLPAPR